MVDAFAQGRSGLRPLGPHDFGAAPMAEPLATWVGRVDGLEQPLPGRWAHWDCRNNRLAWRGLQADGFADAVAAAVQEYQRRLELPYFWDVMARTTRGIIAAYTRGGGGGLWRQARKVRAPVLLVYGIRDKLVSYRMARRAWAAFGNARLLVIPESGHVAMLEHPGAVARGFHELLGVVQDLETSGGS